MAPALFFSLWLLIGLIVKIKDPGTLTLLQLKVGTLIVKNIYTH